MKVLLVSPLDPETPGNLKFLMGGESTYTRTLLENPPKGVDYIHHTQALKKGMIEYLPIQKFVSTLVKFRILPISSGSQCFRLKSYFDLIHCHSYSIKIHDKKVPIVLSDSSSNFLFLRDYLGWSEARIRAGFLIRRFLFNKLGVIDADTNLEKASKLIIFSEFAKRVHLKLGARSEKVMVVPPGLPKPKNLNLLKRGYDKPINILFVGIWFERKGGPIVVEAFKNLAKKYKNIKLTIIGPVADKRSIRHPRIFQVGFVPREKLMREYFPKADILVLVPPKAEGFGFVVLEAASFGIPVIISKICALPELIEDGKSGFVVKPGSVDELFDRLEALIRNKNLRKKMGDAARRRFLEKFSIQISNKQLLEVYRGLT